MSDTFPRFSHKTTAQLCGASAKKTYIRRLKYLYMKLAMWDSVEVNNITTDIRFNITAQRYNENNAFIVM